MSKQTKVITRKELFIDIETTGLNPEVDQIIELAYIYRVNGKIIARVSLTENIYIEFIRDLNSFVNRFNKEDKLYFIGHNAQFDSQFIRNLFLQNKNDFYGAYFYNPPICTMLLAAHKFKQKSLRPVDFKLSTLCEYFKIPVDKDQLHNGLYDITITKDMYNKLIKW